MIRIPTLLLGSVLLLGLCLPSLAGAQTAVVRSGEHDNFSRLVVNLPSPSPWQFGRIADGYELRIDRPDLSFDLGQVFTRIPRTRLAAVAPVPGRSALAISFACACHAVAFEFRPGILVVDLRSGLPDADSAFETPLDTMSAAGSEPAIGPQMRRYDWLDLKSVAAESPSSADRDISGMRMALAEGISAAASEGVLDIAGPKPPVDVSPAATGIPLQIRLAQGDIAAIRLWADGSEAPLPEPGCLGDEVLAIGQWGDEEPAAEQLAFAHGNLLGEFDRPKPAHVVLGARRYLHLGFGREAAQLVSVFAPDDEEAPLIMSMAAVLDGEAPEQDLFAGMENCDSAAALWAVLARPALRSGEKINAGAVVRSFSMLPQHLRLYLVKPLAERLLQQGDLEASARIESSVQRIGATYGAAGDLVGAKLHIAFDQREEAGRLLERLSAEAGELEPEAVIELVRMAAEDGEEPPAARLLDLEAMVQEYRGTPLEVEARDALALGLAASGAFDRALALARETGRGESEIWALLASKGTDSAVLAHAVAAAQAPPEGLKPGLAEHFARRLLALGFPDQARLWLAHAGDMAPEDRRLLAAEIALSARDGDRAMRELAGLDTARADPIRARALLGLGQGGAAAGVFLRNGDRDGAARALRLGRSWRRLAEEGRAPWARPAGMAMGLPDRAGLADKPIAAGLALLEESAQARAALSDLLVATRQ
ncbi:MAG: hypothetical protein LBE86_01690 [Gemmobacter sp.]|jgi:hypothetical protein|nr:hypothetical protein [Gemmobacter sp.]